MTDTIHNPLLQPGLGGAFVRDGFGSPPPFLRKGNALAGMRMGVKDVFLVQGQRMGGGTPVWGTMQAISGVSAPAVQLCLEAGAEWIGKTVTDELAYSLAGINHHYGMPVNAAAPGRLPGGSSSGSAAAVAAGDVDFALGTDAGGSCRLPASYCGVWGVRTTQGRLPGGGFQLAPSFDTVGWFATCGEDMARIHSVMFGEPAPEPGWPLNLLVSEDALHVCHDAVRDAFMRDLPCLDAEQQWLAAGEFTLAHWAQAHRILSAAESWRIHGDWVTAHGEALGAEIRGRFELAAQAAHTLQSDGDAWQKVREAAARMLAALLEETGALMLLPTVPGPAPWHDAAPDDLQRLRERSQQLLCMAGLAGLPQVSFPWRAVGGAPVGLSIIGPRNADARVLAAARQVARRLADQSA